MATVADQVEALAGQHLDARDRRKVRRALDVMPDLVVEGTEIVLLTDGVYDDVTGLLVVTPGNLLFVAEALADVVWEEPRSGVRRVEVVSGVAGSDLLVTTGAETHRFASVGGARWAVELATAIDPSFEPDLDIEEDEPLDAPAPLWCPGCGAGFIAGRVCAECGTTLLATLPDDGDLRLVTGRTDVAGGDPDEPLHDDRVPRRQDLGTVPASPETFLQEVSSALSFLAHHHVSAGAPGTLIVDREYWAWWRIALAILLFPIGLLALAGKDRRSTTVIARRAENDLETSVALSGIISPSVLLCVEDVVDDLRTTSGDDAVTYEFDAWAPTEREDLAVQLVRDGIPHTWNGTDLVVPAAHEAAVDAITDTIEADTDARSRHCPACGHAVAAGKRFCTQCGGALQPTP